jgi:FKBP-type peptidyl-prolyl cis-trans isomerase
MTKKLLIACAAMALGAGVAACGSSKAPGIETAPSGGATTQAAAATTSSSTTPSTSTTPTATTPKTGPLASKPKVSVPSGAPPKTLVVKDLIKGTGKTATNGSTVTVNYVGVLYKGGKEFDSSWKRNQPFTTALSSGSVISGWVKGLDGMKVGGRRELIIPPSEGYGKTGSPPTIPANASLVFVVDLLAVS